MCQLTFGNMNNRDFLKKYILFQSIINSNGRHDDGYGYFYEGEKVLKTKLAAKNIKNLGELLSDINKTKVIAHCRDASPGTPIEDMYAHPFESNNFILAHNGALTIKDGIVLEKPSFSDSENFLNVLDKCYENSKDKDMVKTIKNAMKNFDGTFAFLIYNKITKLFYAVRGKSKTLFTSEITINNTKGYVINTEKDSLDQCTSLIKKLLDLEKVKVDITESKVLDSERIYLLGETIKEIGKINETQAPVYHHNGYVNNRVGNLLKKGINFVPPLLPRDIMLFESMEEWLWLHNLSFKDLDLALHIKFGVTKLSCDANQLEEIFSLLKSAVNITDNTSARVFKFIKDYGQLSSEFYNDYELQFPYFINTDEQVIKAIEKETLFRIKEKQDKLPILM